MRPIRTHNVVAFLPPRLASLRTLAYNLRWTWDHDTLELFRRLNRDSWESVGHNPVRLLATLQQAKLEEAANDTAFLAHLDRVERSLSEYLSHQNTWYGRTHRDAPDLRVAYFSAEFGLSEALPIYSGGLGILAGDHLKSASDLGVPLVGVGLLYREAYFHQYLHQDGWQGEIYLTNDFHNLPITLERRPDGQPLTIQVSYPGRDVSAQIWRVDVGRVPLYLLDANLLANAPEDRNVTERLYRSDPDIRMRQEIMLGIGGLRALHALGLPPTVCHLNEGHSAFLAVERIRLLMKEKGLDFTEAREATFSGNVFTTHTPVPAGIDRFGPELIDRYFGSYYGELGISREEFVALGRQNPYDYGEPFNMAVLALRLSAYRNGVSKLHGQVSRRMWRGLWPGVPEDEVPITSVTNGVHPLTWTNGHEFAALYDRYLGPGWFDHPSNGEVWGRVARIPDEVLWNTHERNRERLVGFARHRVRNHLLRRGASPAEVAHASVVLDPSALTIGFSRRFAAYKRATLLFRDVDRLARILTDAERPVQVIISGKAHPEDKAGKELIRQIVQLAQREDLRRRIVFIEDYDMWVARHLVQGVDVWLTTPRRPLEASGTSGMKVALNGGLNLSILDGWWCEAYRPEVGWAIGQGEEYDDLNYQDEVEANDLYDLLEKEIVPLFYQRGPDDLPTGWIARMKASIRAVCSVFNTNRMVSEYVDRFYVAAAQRQYSLLEGEAERTRALAQWKKQLQAQWPQVRIARVETPSPSEMVVGSDLEVRAEVTLGELQPEDVAVELYHGQVDASHEIAGGTAIPMACLGTNGHGTHIFAGRIPLQSSGLYGYTLRVQPRHDDLAEPHDLGLIVWAD